MRKLLFVAALSVSSLALAQNQPPPTEEPVQPSEAAPPTESAPPTAAQPAQPPAEAPSAENTQPSGETVDDPSLSTGPQGVTQQGTDPDGQATPPAGVNQPPQVTAPGTTPPDQNAAFTPRPPTAEYPRCSRTVTDGCVQSYERGSRPRR